MNLSFMWLLYIKRRLRVQLVPVGRMAEKTGRSLEGQYGYL